MLSRFRSILLHTISPIAAKYCRRAKLSTERLLQTHSRPNGISVRVESGMKNKTQIGFVDSHTNHICWAGLHNHRILVSNHIEMDLLALSRLSPFINDLGVIQIPEFQRILHYVRFNSVIISETRAVAVDGFSNHDGACQPGNIESWMPIAIVGIACRLPDDVSDLENF